MILRIALLSLTIISVTAVTKVYSLPSEPPTRIEVDNDAQAILFIVNGKEAGRITEKGLEVKDSIVYGGTIRDRGRTDENSEEREVDDVP